MTTLEASRCRFCTKRFRYSGALDRHLAREHPHAFHRPFDGGGQRERGTETPGSDYEDIRDDHPPLQDNPDPDPENSGKPETPRPESSVEVYPEAGRPIRDAPEIAAESAKLLELPWYPFANAHEFKQARWMIESTISKTNIDRYFRDGLCTSSDVAFTSGWTLYQQLDKMNPELGPNSWTVREANWSLAGGSNRRTTYYYRSPLSCIKYLLKQPCFREHLVYTPVREYNEAGERMYSEMHMADWWWSTQVCCDAFGDRCFRVLTILHRKPYLQGRRLFPLSSPPTKPT